MATSSSTTRSKDIDDDNLSILDLENVALTGSITARQRDGETREIKCVIQGATLDGGAAETIVKVGHGGNLVFITVYAL